ncbi:hypothetical protein THOM_0114 [Trachipleistophora hominis]|uniref:Uncharacterized protein n=1 Tax=Trachipleistophora hominis TaxID=72359 RepID=L7K0L0_TRAHO|nr:hypothetical protein THOM_0114 [Trachipleistophora hominis]
MLLTQLIIYFTMAIAFYRKNDRAELIRLALEHEKMSMMDEDDMMAEHLRQEGFDVIDRRPRK